eukprot:8139638-Lingulodinium_polyedra.AAC.1
MIGRVAEWMGGRLERNKKKDGWMDHGSMGRWVGRWIDGPIDRWVDASIDQWVDKMRLDGSSA